MSYGIARVSKVKIGAVGNIEKHVERKRDNYRNKDIDNERTQFNYSLFEQEGALINNVMHRIDVGRESTRALRTDAVVLADGIFTASPEFFKYDITEEEQKEFFQDCLEFCKERFGEENLMYFTVHMDETTPHAHFGFVPLKDGSLAWKNYFNSNVRGDLSLRAFQDAFYEQVCVKWGLERGEKRREGDEIVRHKDTEVMKAETRANALREEQEINERLERLRQEEARVSAEVEELGAVVALCERYEHEPRKGKGALLGLIADACDRARGAVEERITATQRLVDRARERVSRIEKRLVEIFKRDVPEGYSVLEVGKPIQQQPGRLPSLQEERARAEEAARAWNNSRLPLDPQRSTGAR